MDDIRNELVQYLIQESNLGIDGVHDGGDASANFEDSGEVYTPKSVAEGYSIYNVTDGSDALVDEDSLYGHAGDGGCNTRDGNIAHAALANGTGDEWDDDDVASIPEVKRFIINNDKCDYASIDVFLDSQDEHNSCYCKIYASNNKLANLNDDKHWKDISLDVFGAEQLSADGIGDAARTITQGIYFIDLSTVALKYMIKIVAECDNGTQNNEFEIRVKQA
jgi:hypothetical protein